MKLRTTGAVAVTALALAAVPTFSTADDSHRGGRSKVTVTLPAPVVEGEQFTIVAQVRKTDGAKTVQLQRSTGSSWELVDKTKAHKRKTYRFQDVAGSEDLVHYRAKVVYEKGRAAVSDTVDAPIWHWTPMTDFDPYYESPGTTFGNNIHITLNGVVYRGGWETSGKYAAWESRMTPGRHCSALRGVTGLGDDSADGSSAVLTVVTDDVSTVYSSPALTPGVAVPFQVDLATPYRLAVQAHQTSLPTAPAYPAIATPELLCTGLG